jgi:hypothetical protein
VRQRDQDLIGVLEPLLLAELEFRRRGKWMAMLHPVRKACPPCGKPMKAVPDEASEGQSRSSASTATTNLCATPTLSNGRTVRCGVRSRRDFASRAQFS